ncbi:hypothetical protein Ct61P_07951 [Colletotrichum tofieldiae]|nr:hypothetical protein Ct61P_07951 [Colletotrichum tofieldiae]
MVYNAETRTCVAPAAAVAPVLARPACAMGEMAYGSKSSTNYVAYDATNPLCHNDGFNMVFCSSPARVMATLRVGTFASVNHPTVPNVTSDNRENFPVSAVNYTSPTDTSVAEAETK